MEHWLIIAAGILICYMVRSGNADISERRPHSQIVAQNASHGARMLASGAANASAHAWSEWGAWSPCSRSCGGGVSVQERHCLPSDDNRWIRSRRRRIPGQEERNQLRRTRDHQTWRTNKHFSSRTNQTLSRTSKGYNEWSNERRDRKENDRDFGERDRVHRRAREAKDTGIGCRGLAKRYHECNTAPCAGATRDSREEQCSAYDKRPFKGRFYTWVPYVDAESACILNCRPRGQQFYASLSLVADGTPCTKPGFRAICVQGTCKVVGREGVLSTASARDVRCGRRLVSGLFSRPRLPLGYSHIATVPRGACRLNVSELLPSENYIALKLTNGSYIMNGEFAVSSPGTYEAAGAQFVYRRGAGVETIYSHGPTLQSLDIMILYQHPNPSIKYEYLTDTLPEEAVSLDSPPEAASSVATPHHHRHHNTDLHDPSEPPKEAPSQRKFTWRILSFNQCSRSCGGGIQIGKFRCVEEPNSKEVSSVHCTGSAPAPRRRRCNMASCPPRWRTTTWSSCPACGPAAQTRNVGCVQDHSRGMTKISDKKCTTPMPPTSQPCDIPVCNKVPESRGQDTRRQVHERERTERFFGSNRPPLTRPYNRTRLDTDNDISAVLGPEYVSSVGGWLYTEWSECVGWCVGGGVRTRGVRCADPAGCPAARAPDSQQTCTPRAACEPHTTHWFTGDWSACSSECGGRQVRAAVCLGGAGRRARDAACAEPRPPTERPCGGPCRPAWFYSDWSQCTGACGSGGVQSRTVWCARADAAPPAREEECPAPRPPARRPCVPAHCPSPDSPVGDVTPAVTDAPPAVYYPQPSQPSITTQDPLRIPRNQSPRLNSIDDQTNSIVAKEGCTDRLSKCSLAAQARLCASPYYGHYCCRSCTNYKV